jgi:hypothetical protein
MVGPTVALGGVRREEFAALQAGRRRGAEVEMVVA